SVISVPDPTTTGCGGGFTTILLNDSGGSLTINRATTAVFNIISGYSTSDAQTTFTLANGNYATINSPDSINWTVRTTITPSFSVLTGSATCAQLPALTGDTTTSAGSCATITAKINGTAFSGTANDVVAFGSGGNIPLDSGIPYTQLNYNTANFTSGNVVASNGNHTTADGGAVAANLTTSAANGTSGDFAQYAGNNKTLSDSGIAVANAVTAASNLTSGAPVVGNGTKGISGSATAHQLELPLPCPDT